jgi:hypothetical protein
LRLTGISPTAGPLAGGNEVTIRADGAADVTSVAFGAASVRTITHLGAHLLHVVAPAHDAGDVDIVLHSASATAPVTSAGRYSFVANPDRLQLQVSPRLESRHLLGAGDLTAIGCTVHDFCAATMTRYHKATLVTFGHGHQRRIQQLPEQTFLDDLVACGTAGFCVAGDAKGLWTWNGHRWSGPTQLGTGSTWALSCAPGTRRCVLSGQNDTFVHGRHGWRTARYPHGFRRPTSLACATARFCVAVKNGRTVRFDGTSWHATHARSVPGNIACAAAHYCLAVGRYRAAVFAGTDWHAVAAPPTTVNILAVSCVAAGRCAAVTQRFAETFTHGRWTTSHVLSARRSFAPDPVKLTDLACVPRGICRATDGRGQDLRLVHGDWTGAENITGYHDRLNDISCASANWCMAVSGSGEAFRYSGGQWSHEGNVDARQPLVAISCTEDKVCVAVDGATGTKHSGVLSGGRAVRYSHGSWHRPVAIDTRHWLTDVSCASGDHCVAVDVAGRAITYRHGKWSDPVLIRKPNPNGLLFEPSIACPTVHYCATAGNPGSFELVHGTWRAIDSGQPRVRDNGAPLDCLTANYCMFTDNYFGIVIRNHGVVGWGHKDDACCRGGRPVSCASRTYCAAVITDLLPYSRVVRTYLLAGAAVSHPRKLSNRGEPGEPRGLACFAGPVCIGVTDTNGLVGT